MEENIRGALTGSAVSSSGTIQGPTGSFEHISSSGAIFGGILQILLIQGYKTVVFDDASGQLFTTQSTAAGVPSLFEAVSKVNSF